MRERYYPPAYDRAAEMIERLAIKATGAYVYMDSAKTGVQLLLQGIRIGAYAAVTGEKQSESDCQHLELAQDEVDKALEVHPGSGSTDTKAGEAYRYIAEGGDALEGEYGRMAALSVEFFTKIKYDLGGSGTRIEAIYRTIDEGVKIAESSLKYWHAAREETQRVIERRTIETIVLDGGKQNIANAKEQLQPPTIESGTDAENSTPAAATANLREAKETLASLPQRVQNIRTAVGAMLTDYEESSRVLMNWNPEIQGPEPDGLREKHTLMEQLIQEVTLTLTAQQAEKQANEVAASYEAMDTVTGIAAEGRSMNERAVAGLDASENHLEPYIIRGYD